MPTTAFDHAAPSHDLRRAAVVGLVPAALECALLLGVEPGLERWHLAQAVSFWFTCGFVVHLAAPAGAPLLRAVLLTMLLCMPWHIVEAIRPGQLDHLAPLVVASAVFGLVIALVSRRLRR